jgi:hypothetical protein
MALNTAPQKPTKLYTYKVDYILANGDSQDAIITSAAGKTALFNALELLRQALSPTSAVSEIHIKIGDGKDTA